MTEWWRSFAGFWGAERYSQHSICLTNDPILMTFYVAADFTIWASYFAIGVSLFCRHRVMAELNPVAIILYSAFIFLCGITHLSDVLLLFSGMYRLDILIRILTAAVSAVTAAYTVTALWGERRAPS